MGKRRLRLPGMALAATNLLMLGMGLSAQERFVPPPPSGPAIRLEAQPPAAPMELRPAAPVAPPAPAAGSSDSAAIRVIVEDILKKRDEEAKKKEAEKKAADEAMGTVVGDDKKLNATIDNGGFRYKSGDGAFNIHFGGRLMSDFVWFNQSAGLKAGTGQNDGQPQRTGVGPGIGVLQDGFFIRRARIIADGTFHENFEFKTEMDLENYNNLAFDEMYIGAKNIPFFDTIRIGQVHVPFGLEAYSSSRWLETLERSPVFDAFYQEFAPGFFWGKSFLDQRIFMANLFHRIDGYNQFNGDSFGNGKYAYSGRLAALPVYEDGGRHLIHLTIDYQWRTGNVSSDFNGSNGQAGLAIIPPPAGVTTNTDIFRFRTRQGIRDAIGAQGDGARIVDTGNIIGSHVNSLNPELLVYWGRFWLQSEGCWSRVSDAVYPTATASNPFTPPTAGQIATAATATNRGTLDFFGAYIMCGVFLTGEHRGYDKRFGKLDRNVPLENFFMVRGEDGHVHSGLGAWELVYRFGVDDLNSAASVPGALPVQGGIYNEHTFGLNWYWSPNIKFQFNYILGNRIVPQVGAPAPNNGFVNGFGLRGALEF